MTLTPSGIWRMHTASGSDKQRSALSGWEHSTTCWLKTTCTTASRETTSITASSLSTNSWLSTNTLTDISLLNSSSSDLNLGLGRAAGLTTEGWLSNSMRTSMAGSKQPHWNSTWNPGMNQGPFGGSLSINLRRSLRLVGPHPNDHPAKATNAMNNGEIMNYQCDGWWF